MMKKVDEINADIHSLYTQGLSLLDADCGAIMNSERRWCIDHFEQIGGIAPKSELYKYLNLASIYGKDYNVSLKKTEASIDRDEIFRCTVTNLDTYPILTSNGRFCRDNIEIKEEDIVVCSLQEASIKYADLFSKYYNVIAKQASADAQVCINGSMAQDGVFIYVPDNAYIEKPVQLINLLSARKDLMAFQRNLIVIGKNAKLTLLVCDHTTSYNRFLSNNLSEIYLLDNAELDFYEVQNHFMGTSLINGIYIDQQRDSRFHSNFVTLYGGVIRNNLYTALNGTGASCELYGMYIEDKNQKVDNYTNVEHVAENCNSKQHYKGVIDDSALANFAGIIKVHPTAQKTEALQANNNLILKDTARVNAKPQLIIDADDVKCSHGATVGQIDEEAMFYLRSRGIGLEEAKLILMFGFAHDIIGRVKLDALREKIDELVNARLRGELSKCTNCTHCGQSSNDKA